MKTLFTLYFLFASAFLFGQKLVLIEQFTNASCGSCANYTPQVMQYVEENPETVTAIAYHGPYPGLDSMYYESKDDVDTRMNFYEALSVPTSIVDGNHFSGSSYSLLQNIASTISERASETADYDIRFHQVQLDGTIINGEVSVTKTETASTENTVLFIVLVEKLVLKSAYASNPGNNSENKYHYVVRKIVSSPNGDHLDFTSSEASSMFEWDIQNFKNLEELRIVAFMQDTETKEIFQSAIYDPGSATSIRPANQFYIKLFPNPAMDFITLSHTSAFEDQSVEIYNIQGKRVQSFEIPSGFNYNIDISHFKPGMYFMKSDTFQNLKFVKQ